MFLRFIVLRNVLPELLVYEFMVKVFNYVSRLLCLSFLQAALAQLPVKVDVQVGLLPHNALISDLLGSAAPLLQEGHVPEVLLHFFVHLERVHLDNILALTPRLGLNVARLRAFLSI